ncbi:tRNA threonylcarbamoyladenosine biosynthesis protein [Emticicia aquatilis]|uniref:Threonylcarbamoyl-AMP synthase n=1 Tax=Emticicia aquatilis TaxID=1537369 RepID=A0A917DPB1_9BACT|nr:L-threonylcarbamoyladenylate synthase [Emticicia aquatilis]GGD57021.1 tRNA threonylcarbamoyladenosine biosynthesis protein [Emticicia aquatilis]
MAVIGKDIKEAIEILKSGEVIGMPTETVYGLAGNAYNTEAITKIFTVKNRPTFDPLIVHTSSIERVHEFVSEIPEKAQLLAKHFMPGPLTLLLPKKDVISDLVTSGLDTVAVRIPNHPLALQLLENLDFPLAAPSANPFGYISPTSAQHVDNQLGDKIKYILDGGECKVGIESSIIGFFDGEIVVLRKGGLAIEEIEAIVGKVRIEEHSSSNPKAPGMLKSHYAPRTQLLFTGDLLLAHEDTKLIGYLGFDKFHTSIPQENQLLLSPAGDLNEAAKHLFAYMRLLDARGFDKIYTDLLPEKGLGRAINDRIKRATTQE